MKYAVFSMDVEDWYHLDYFTRKDCVSNYSMLDGLSIYSQILSTYQIPSSFFVLGKLVHPLKNKLLELSEIGHEISSHGQDHIRPLTKDITSFELEVDNSKKELEDVLGKPVLGYRAPCFSLDRERLDILKRLNYKYDSSRILFGDHPLYGDIDVRGFKQKNSEIFFQDDFFEFQVSTLTVKGKQIPVSGGGYLRIFPWAVMKRMLVKYFQNHDLYVLYIHPFELSNRPHPPFPKRTSWKNKVRFSLGRSTVQNKLINLINLLRKHQFHFTTFSSLRKKMLYDKG